METIGENVKNIIRSENFKNQLREIDQDFFNIKQERHIRDALVKYLNQKFRSEASSLRALPEFPRAERSASEPYGVRDIGIFECSEKDGLPCNVKNPSDTIELKFNYPLDLFKVDNENGYGPRSNEDVSAIKADVSRVICKSRCNLFVLVVCFRPWANRDCQGVVVPEREAFGNFINDGGHAARLSERKRFESGIGELLGMAFSGHWVDIDSTPSRRTAYFFGIVGN